MSIVVVDLSAVVATLFVLGVIILLIGLILATVGIYFVAKWIAPGLGIDPDRAATVALVASIANMILWLVLSVAVTAG